MTNRDRVRRVIYAASGAIALSALGLLTTGSRGEGPSSPARPARVLDTLPDQRKVAKKKEHCSVDAGQLAGIGRATGQQVRIYRNESDFAAFTVAEARREDPGSTVRMGRFARLRLGSSETFEGSIVSTVPAPSLTVDQARDRGELVERLDDDGSNTGLLVLAPHGGEIESSTDLQAERVAEKLRGLRVSTWRCKGFGPRGGKSAFDRWHITSTDISEASYPLLGKVAGRRFEHAVSFHGMADDRVLIGGSAPMRLKREVQDAIRAALGDARITVAVALPGDSNGGKDPKNIVNRYAPGIQVEQSPRSRREHWREIADAVAGVYASKL